MSVSDSPKQIKEYPISPSVIPNESIKIVPYDSDAFSILRGTKFTNTLYNVTQERPGNSNILQNTHVQAFYSNSHGIFLLSPEGTVTWISYPSGENTAKEMILHEPHFPEIYTSLMGVTDFRVVPSTPHSKIFLKDITGWLLYTEI